MRHLAVFVLLTLVACAATAPATRPTSPCPSFATSAVAPTAVAPLLVRTTGRRLAYVFRSSRTANLLYEIDCLAGLFACSRPAYETLWKERLGGLSDEDRKAIDVWRTFREQYSGRIEARVDSAGPSPGLPFPEPAYSLADRVRIAGRDATSLDELARSLAVIAKARDVDAAMAVVRRFDARFDVEWARVRAAVDEATRGFARVIARPDVVALIDGIVAFYDPDLPPNASVTFDVMHRPKHESPDFGDVVEDHATIELIEGQAPAQRLDVVLHELFHTLFAGGAREKKMRLASRFASAPDSVGRASYAVLDEVLAATFAQGMIDRALVPERFAGRQRAPKGFYFDAAVDGLVRTWLPRADQQLASHATLHDDGFQVAFADAAREAFPRGAPASLLLRQSMIVRAPELPSLHAALESLMLVEWDTESDASDPGLRETFARWSKVVSLWVVLRTRLAPLAAAKELLGDDAVRVATARARSRGSFILATRRPNGVRAFVVVLETADDWKPLIQRFIAGPIPRDGDGVVAELRAPSPP